MPVPVGQSFAEAMQSLSPAVENYVPDLVSLILRQSRAHRASDVHLVPCEDGLRMDWRIDGVLQTVAFFDRELSPRVIARLKVICALLTYRTDVPQEGRVAREHSASEIRVTTFPTLYGEKAAVRLFAESDHLQHLAQLGLPPSIEAGLRQQLTATDGVILLTGPSGSGKTTTVYACLREILNSGPAPRSIMTLEDPVEVAVRGVTQSQVRPHAGFDLATGLRSLMRQDPDVIMVGEIRDPATAEVVFQAALTGHLVLTTFHAGSSVEAITRLLDMGIEPYLIRSTLRSVVCQRLLRRAGSGSLDSADQTRLSTQSNKLVNETDKTVVLRDSDAGIDSPTDSDGALVGLSAAYYGRLVLAEMLDPDQPAVAQAILERRDARHLAEVARSCGFRTLRDSAADAVAEGRTSQQEVFRVLGADRTDTL